MSDEDPSGFGPLLRQFRMSVGLTQEALAEAAGLSARGIQELERGDHQPYRDTVDRLVRALRLGTEDGRRLSLAGRPRGRGPGSRPVGVGWQGSVPAALSSARSAEPGSACEPVARHNLPAELTSLVGREREIARVRELLGRTRLLTLTGPGGCGKTRLARRVAGEIRGEYREGVWLVELASVADPALTCRCLASTLSVRERTGEPLLDRLRSELRGRKLLLLLDNCEHVVEECAQVAESILRSCPEVQVLATSREALRVSGEVAMSVPPLAVPEDGQTTDPEQVSAYDAVTLLVERAQAVRPGFAVTAANARAVAEVVTRLDGMPLSLELAAARLDSLSIQQLAARLDEPLDLLVCGPRTAPARQRTLRDAMDWSYRLLSEPERALFRRLALLGTTFSLEAAEVACSDVECLLELLSCLVRKSLVLAEEHAGETRYRLLGTIREYAMARLAEEARPAPARTRDQDWVFLGVPWGKPAPQLARRSRDSTGASGFRPREADWRSAATVAD